MNKTSLPDEMKIACCLTCTLATAMRDCRNCDFKIGLIVKGLQAENNNIPQIDTASLMAVSSNLILSKN